MAFIDNVNHMIRQAEKGEATEGQLNFLDWWYAAGQPQTQAEFRQFTGPDGVNGRDYDDFAGSGGPDNPFRPDYNPNANVSTDPDDLYDGIQGPYKDDPEYDLRSTITPENIQAYIFSNRDVYNTPEKIKQFYANNGIEYDGFTISPEDMAGYETQKNLTLGGGGVPIGESVVGPIDPYVPPSTNPNNDPFYPDKPVTRPPLTPIPVVTQPPVTTPPVTETPVTETPVTETPVTETPPETSWPDTPEPDVDKPTDDWYWTNPVGYENAPQPEGDGSFEEGNPPADTSWDWDYFREKAPGDRQWGGYDVDYQAFERYQPGMDSPWGMPNIKGGNKDFYQQQFVNLLRDEQGFRNRQKEAQRVRFEAQNNPYTAPPVEEMWSWAYGGEGLPEVQMGGGAPEVNWDLNSAFTPGQSTNADIFRWAANNNSFGEDQRHWYSKHLANPDAQEGMDSTYFSSAGDPNVLIGNLPTDNNVLTRENQRYMVDLFNTLYNPGQLGPYAPSGYASPLNQTSTGA